MGRKITAGILHPVTLFDAAGNPTGNQTSPASQPAVPGLSAAPAANTAAQVVAPAPGAGAFNTVGQVEWSYDDTPTGGQLTVTDGVAVRTYYVTSGGPGFIAWDPPLKFANNAPVTVTLAAGGAGISGTVNVHAWTE